MLVVCLFNALATVLQMKDTGKGKKRVELLMDLIDLIYSKNND